MTTLAELVRIKNLSEYDRQAEAMLAYDLRNMRNLPPDKVVLTDTNGSKYTTSYIVAREFNLTESIVSYRIRQLPGEYFTPLAQGGYRMGLVGFLFLANHFMGENIQQFIDGFHVS